MDSLYWTKWMLVRMRPNNSRARVGFQGASVCGSAKIERFIQRKPVAQRKCCHLLFIESAKNCGLETFWAQSDGRPRRDLTRVIGMKGATSGFAMC
jgi:hypothetical protein